jgi:hypothetical protein
MITPYAGDLWGLIIMMRETSGVSSFMLETSEASSFLYITADLLSAYRPPHIQPFCNCKSAYQIKDMFYRIIDR